MRLNAALIAHARKRLLSGTSALLMYQKTARLAWLGPFSEPGRPPGLSCASAAGGLASAS